MILKCNRFPFIASEIFNCEINQILERFFEEKKPEEAKSEQEEEEPDEK